MHLRLRLPRPTHLRARREDWLAAAVWLSALLALENLGGHWRSDAVDGLFLSGLLALALGTLVLHRQVDIAWVAALTRGVDHLRQRCKHLLPGGVRIGIDFRGTPPLPQRIPGVLLLEALAAGALLGVLIPLSRFTPEGLRALADTSYVAYLLLLGLAWLWAGFVAFLGFMLPLAAQSDRLSHVTDRGRPRLGRRRGTLIGAAALLLAAAFVPARYAALAALAVTALAALVLAACPARHGFVWHHRGRTYGLRWRSLAMVVGSVGLALTCIPLLLCLGDELWRPATGVTTMALTRFLGRTLAWSLLTLSVTLLVLLVGLSGRALAFERAGRRRPPVRLEGQVSPSDLAALRKLGWRRAGRRSERGELRLFFRPDAAPIDPLFGPTLPPEVPPGWLAEPGAGARLQRRWIQDMRRRVFRAVTRALNEASGRTYERGRGYFLAPHLWFVRGLMRDEPEPEGPEHILPFTRSWSMGLTWAARSHLAQVLSDLEIDLIFVEDGLGARRTVRALRVLFELHDTHGPGRASERHLSLIPGVRAILQEDVGSETELAGSTYPEPDYEDVGRARVLLLLRDRGEGRPEVDAPRGSRWTPVPLGS